MSGLPCPVDWCDLGRDRPHSVHEQTAVTIPAVRVGDGDESGCMVQLIVAGVSATAARPVVAIVDDVLTQTSAGLDWSAAHELATAMIGADARFRRLSVPPD